MKFKVNRIRKKVHVQNFRILGMPWLEELTSEQAEEITRWVDENELGRRVAYDMWQLKSDHAVTMFMLKYG